MDNHETVLGKVVPYIEEYNPGVLTPIQRDHGGLAARAAHGGDRWRCYEMTCLGPRGMPMSMALTIDIPASSEFLVESKSLKLYLGSFAQTKVGSASELEEAIAYDLGELLHTKASVSALPIGHPSLNPLPPPGACIDGVDLDRPSTQGRDPGLLRGQGGHCRQALHTNLLRTLCPVTGQPDMGTVIIDCAGERIDPEGLLAYIVSLRHEHCFHERCCEQIFSDLMERLTLTELTVSCCFLRRGGIDINPWRSTEQRDAAPQRTTRQ
ncbi:MAG: NADPH-dependent 7-cyano-7-deazaguanine reductase QueF [Succinivibrionaceae bacterium]|nr:NADPH-dependent 7-cyano-7-deazaguanine reductase QueF [Succinivibrionaceae bacterium]